MIMSFFFFFFSFFFFFFSIAETAHGVTAEISARRGGNARFERGMASSDVRRGRATVACVRTGV